MEKKFNIKELQWKDVRADVLCFEPELAKIIDELDPKFPIFKLSYHYGAKIFENGIFNIPTSDKQVLPITDQNIPTKIKEQLGYNSLPLGFVLEHGVEVYADLEDRIFSLSYFQHGLNLGIYEFFSPPTPFAISAGARSIFMLPKLTEVARHKDLKPLGVRSQIPIGYFDQWKIFTELTNHKNFREHWHSEILFFPSAWIEKIKNDKKWRNFYNYILIRIWEHTEYSRNKTMLDTMWESFSRLLSKNRIKPNSYTIDTLKHLISVASGTLPGFAPVVDNSMAPANSLLKIYLDVYGLKYTPSMMQPKHFHTNTKEHAYYSLQLPTYLESIPRFRESGSTRTELVELIELSDLFMAEFLNDDSPTKAVHSIYKSLQSIEFNYFHSEKNIDAGIFPTSDMPKEDKNLLYAPKGCTKKPFCEKSSFVRGCVRISNKFY